jgi:hypothetical protein
MGGLGADPGVSRIGSHTAGATGVGILLRVHSTEDYHIELRIKLMVVLQGHPAT